MKNWAEILHKDRPWQECYPEVAEAVREFLDARPGASYSTKNLAEELFPSKLAKGNMADARRRFFSALWAQEERGLMGYSRVGRLDARGNRPRLWSTPKAGVLRSCVRTPESIGHQRDRYVDASFQGGISTAHGRG